MQRCLHQVPRCSAALLPPVSPALVPLELRCFLALPHAPLQRPPLTSAGIGFGRIRVAPGPHSPPLTCAIAHHERIVVVAAAQAWALQRWSFIAAALAAVVAPRRAFLALVHAADFAEVEVDLRLRPAARKRFERGGCMLLLCKYECARSERI